MVLLIWRWYRYIGAYKTSTQSELLPTTISRSPSATTSCASSLLRPKNEQIRITTGQATIFPPSYVLTQQQQQENQQQNDVRM